MRRRPLAVDEIEGSLRHSTASGLSGSAMLVTEGKTLSSRASASSWLVCLVSHVILHTSSRRECLRLISQSQSFAAGLLFSLSFLQFLGLLGLAALSWAAMLLRLYEFRRLYRSPY